VSNEKARIFYLQTLYDDSRGLKDVRVGRGYQLCATTRTVLCCWCHDRFVTLQAVLQQFCPAEDAEMMVFVERGEIPA
jgi:hypothetical protein